MLEIPKQKLNVGTNIKCWKKDWILKQRLNVEIPKKNQMLEAFFSRLNFSAWAFHAAWQEREKTGWLDKAITLSFDHQALFVLHQTLKVLDYLLHAKL